jgi:hypothetical protein
MPAGKCETTGGSKGSLIPGSARHGWGARPALLLLQIELTVDPILFRHDPPMELQFLVEELAAGTPQRGLEGGPSLPSGRKHGTPLAVGPVLVEAADAMVEVPIPAAAPRGRRRHAERNCPPRRRPAKPPPQARR